MLEAVTTTHPDREGLENYILGGRKRGTPVGSVPNAQFKSARLPSKPGQQPSEGKRPIPTSSQKPWQQSNQHIPYARFMFSPKGLYDSDPTVHDLSTGDIVFVHKTSAGRGPGAPNRTVRVASISMLNQMLSFDNKILDPFTTDPNIQTRIREAREEYAYQQLVEYEWELRQWLRRAYPMRDAAWHEATVRFSRMVGDHELLFVEWTIWRYKPRPDLPFAPSINEPIGMMRHRSDWMAIPLLREFTVDGVVLNVDDDDKESRDASVMDQRNDGVLVNVVVQGPTPCRNSKHHHAVQLEGHVDAPQVIDFGPAPLDTFFVGLFCKPIRDDRGRRTGACSFYYKCFSGRQCWCLVNQLVPNLNGHAPGYVAGTGGLETGPTQEEFTYLCQAWKIGKVMDTRQNPDSKVLLNVNIELYTLQRINEEYHAYKGKTPPGRPRVVPVRVSAPPALARSESAPSTYTPPPAPPPPAPEPPGPAGGAPELSAETDVAFERFLKRIETRFKQEKWKRAEEDAEKAKQAVEFFKTNPGGLDWKFQKDLYFIYDNWFTFDVNRGYAPTELYVFWDTIRDKPWSSALNSVLKQGTGPKLGTFEYGNLQPFITRPDLPDDVKNRIVAMKELYDLVKEYQWIGTARYSINTLVVNNASASTPKTLDYLGHLVDKEKKRTESAPPADAP